ncbi:hypothetical protein LY78DRAFT_11807 [Colletotrichum sublineola]|nr:hypothetical protein LY78DRAFT_11807 [Colletotrichum sublineola]
MDGYLLWLRVANLVRHICQLVKTSVATNEHYPGVAGCEHLPFAVHGPNARAIDCLHGPDNLPVAARSLDWPVLELPQPPFELPSLSRPFLPGVEARRLLLRPRREPPIDRFSHLYEDRTMGHLRRGIPPLDCLSATAAQLMQVDGRTCKNEAGWGLP